jgi:molybdenum cofactor cytidylyltransferase
VLGAHVDEICRVLQNDGANVVTNREWREGQLSSIQTAIRSLPAGETEGLILCPVDRPLISAALVAELIGAFDRSGRLIAMPVYQGRRGHPVIFRSSLYEQLLSASPQLGARQVVWAHPGEVEEVATDEEGVILNIDDRETLRRIKEKLV